MKKRHILSSLMLLFISASVFGQSAQKETSVRMKMKKAPESQYPGYQAGQKPATKDSLDSLNKNRGNPVLDDNGAANTTGTIDGRSSTGRPEADTVSANKNNTETYYIKKTRKKTIRTVDAPAGKVE